MAVHEFKKPLFKYPAAEVSMPVEKTKIEIKCPLIGKDTNNSRDIQIFLDLLNSKVRTFDEGNVACIIINGDEQRVSMIWNEKCQDLNNNMWMIPFPGEFHFLVHITLAAMYRLFAKVLIPFTSFMKRDKITDDFLSKYWHKQEDFLMMMIEGIAKWLEQVIAFPAGTTAQQLLDGVENNKTIYNVLYFFFHFSVFYWNLRQEIHKGNVNAVSYAWIYSQLAIISCDQQVSIRETLSNSHLL